MDRNALNKYFTKLSKGIISSHKTISIFEILAQVTHRQVQGELLKLLGTGLKFAQRHIQLIQYYN